MRATALAVCAGMPLTDSMRMPARMPCAANWSLFLTRLTSTPPGAVVIVTPACVPAGSGTRTAAAGGGGAPVWESPKVAARQVGQVGVWLHHRAAHAAHMGWPHGPSRAAVSAQHAQQQSMSEKGAEGGLASRCTLKSHIPPKKYGAQGGKAACRQKMEHQNWDVVTFAPKPAPGPGPPMGARTKEGPDDDDRAPRRVEADLKRALMQARAAKGMTQKQLAQVAQVPVQRIVAMENGTALADNALVASLERHLGAKLPRTRKIRGKAPL